MAQETQQPVLAIGAPFPIPFFDLQHTDHELIITGGLNALMAKPLATIERVGLLPAAEAQRDYHLVAANVFLIGGEQKLLGRSGLRKEKQLAYQDKTPAASEGEQPAAPATLPTREEARTSVTENKATSSAEEPPLPTRESRRHQR